MKNVKLSPANIVILAAGAVMLIGSFLGFYKGTNIIGQRQSFSAWSSGLFLIATLPALLGILMAVQIALVTFGNINMPHKPLGMTWDQVHLVLGFQAAVLMLAFLVTSKGGIDFGVGFWLMLIAGIALPVGAVMRVTGAGTKPRAV